MGLNLVVGCAECRERAWIYRGEGQEIEEFYHRHRRCAREWRGSILLSDDQSDDAWVNDPRWTEEELPKDEGVSKRKP